jgi:hypothetical protein
MSTNFYINRNFSSKFSWYFENLELIGDTAEGTRLRRRGDTIFLQESARFAVSNHLSRCEDGTRRRKALNARRDVNGLSEVVLSIVERNRQTRPGVDTDLEKQIAI